MAEYYKIKVADLYPAPLRSVARPRQLAMALAKELTNHSLPEIGDAFGGRMILLERIIPYSKQIRNMQDSISTYYAARSEVELGKLQFQKSSGTIRVLTDTTVYDRERINIDLEDRIRGGDPVVLKTPVLSPTENQEYAIVAVDTVLPLGIRLYENDENSRGFGTNRGDPTSHLLSSFGGGVTFDLSGVDTDSSFYIYLNTNP